MHDRFEAAVDAMVTGDAHSPKALLREDPSLATAKSPREHRAAMLHHIAANGVENERQKTPLNAVEIAEMLVPKSTPWRTHTEEETSRRHPSCC